MGKRRGGLGTCNTGKKEKSEGGEVEGREEGWEGHTVPPPLKSYFDHWEPILYNRFINKSVFT